MIDYEFPLNERVRTLLRLEDLFYRVELFINRNDSIDHHAALGVLFEILEWPRAPTSSPICCKNSNAKRKYLPPCTAIPRYRNRAGSHPERN